MHLRCKLNSVLKWCLLSPHPLRNCSSTEVVCILCCKKPLRKRERREDVRTGIRRPGLGKVVWPPWALVFRPIKWKRGARWSCEISSNSKTVDWELDLCDHDTPFTFIPLCNHHNSKRNSYFSDEETEAQRISDLFNSTQLKWQGLHSGLEQKHHDFTPKCFSLHPSYNQLSPYAWFHNVF